MPSVLSDTEITDLANNCFDPETLRAAYSSFTWRKSVLPEAYEKRLDLENETRSWLVGGTAKGGRIVAQHVYEWGFGRKTLPGDCNDLAWEEKFFNALRYWHQFDGVANDAAQDALVRLLSVKGSGIATVSKWICFVSQTQYAIYDSRVSRALRHVVVGGKRIFPLVPSKTENRTWNVADITAGSDAARHTTNAYVTFLTFARVLSSRVGLSVAQIEMALFMLGKTLPSTESRAPFARERYDA